MEPLQVVNKSKAARVLITFLWVNPNAKVPSSFFVSENSIVSSQDVRCLALLASTCVLVHIKEAKPVLFVCLFFGCIAKKSRGKPWGWGLAFSDSVFSFITKVIVHPRPLTIQHQHLSAKR